MSTTALTHPETAGFPALSARTLATIIVAGCIATVAFDLFGQAISPMLGFASLAPIPLATRTWQALFGDAYGPEGHLLHYIAGVIAYPIGWMFIWRPAMERIAPQLNWFVLATLYGVGLWVFALYMMAHLVAGNPAFLGFIQLTWVALVGHILFAWVIAFLVRLRT